MMSRQSRIQKEWLLPRFIGAAGAILMMVSAGAYVHAQQGMTDFLTVAVPFFTGLVLVYIGAEMKDQGRSNP